MTKKGFRLVSLSFQRVRGRGGGQIIFASPAKGLALIKVWILITVFVPYFVTTRKQKRMRVNIIVVLIKLNNR